MLVGKVRKGRNDLHPEVFAKAIIKMLSERRIHHGFKAKSVKLSWDNGCVSEYFLKLHSSLKMLFKQLQKLAQPQLCGDAHTAASAMPILVSASL